jgi:cytochrome c oxidase cbb3-type subunit IV
MNSATISGLITLVLLLAFVGGWIWAWSSKRKPQFDAAARLPLEDDQPPRDVDNASEEKTP